MDILLKALAHPFTWGLGLGLVFAAWAFFSGWSAKRALRREVRRLEDHCRTAADLSAKGTQVLQEEVAGLKEQNQNLQITVSELKNKPDRAELQKLYVLGKILPHGGAIVHLHEFAWYKPNGKATRFQPPCRKHHEVTVKPRKPRNTDACLVTDGLLQSHFRLCIDVVVARIRRICSEKVELCIGLLAQKVRASQFHGRALPQRGGRLEIVRINLESQRSRRLA